MAPKEEKKDVEMKEEEKKEEAKKEEKAAPEEKKEETTPEVAKPKEPEPPKELEEDAPALKGAKAKNVALNFDDSTLNVMPSNSGKILQTLSEGGMQYLLAGVRSNTGIKSGRYMFEVEILENLSPEEKQGERTPQPRQVVRAGFSLGGSSLFIADGADNVGFDSEGFFMNDKIRKKVGQKFTRDMTAAVLLNLDAASPNKNTISLFINGERACPPQPLPENLCGKTLYPTVTYKNVTLDVNLGPTARKPLPFACHMVGGAAAADVEVTKPAKAAKDGKHEVVYPVGLPEQGFFDWVDDFVEKNPGYHELSDRKILEWAMKSGLWRPKGASPGSNDKPESRFGISQLDNWSVRTVLNSIAPRLPRNYIVAELKSNLVAADREASLKRFVAQDFKRKAVVIMGEPSADYKTRVHSLILGEKKAQAEAEAKRLTLQAEQKRLLEQRKKMAEDAKKAREAALKKKEGKEEEKKEEETEETKAEEPEEVKAVEPEPVELTEEEKALCYRKLPTPDFTEIVLSKNYASFSTPTKEEGFDEVAFAWQSEAKCADLLKKWILEKKLTQRAEDLKPGATFTEALAKWTKTLQDWRRVQTEWKDPAKRKAAAEKKKKEAAAKLEVERKRLLEAGDEDAAKVLEEEAKKGPTPMEIDFDDLDVFAVEDVSDLGDGQPLFSKFEHEDWTLLSTRYELHLLLHSFKKDLDDADRPSFGEKHLGFYYQKYFKKSWNFGQFCLPKFETLIDLIKDAISIDATSGFLKAEHPDDLTADMFVKLAEDHRRERERRVDAGDETAKLKFVQPNPTKPQPPGPVGKGAGWGFPGGAGFAGNAFAAQKRPFTPGPQPFANKQPRPAFPGGFFM